VIVRFSDEKLSVSLNDLPLTIIIILELY
jgi:hypothetical protein